MKIFIAQLVLTVALVNFSLNVAFAETKPFAEVAVTLNPAGDFVGKTSDVTGTAFKKGDGVGASRIEVDLRKLETGMPLRDQHAREKYLKVKEFPKAILTDAKGSGGKGTAKIEIKGIKKDISGSYKLIDGEKFLDAKFKLNLTDFDIKDISYMGVGVEEEVEVHVVVAMGAEPAAPSAPPPAAAAVEPKVAPKAATGKPAPKPAVKKAAPAKPAAKATPAKKAKGQK